MFDYAQELELETNFGSDADKGTSSKNYIARRNNKRQKISETNEGKWIVFLRNLHFSKISED